MTVVQTITFGFLFIQPVAVFASPINPRIEASTPSSACALLAHNVVSPKHSANVEKLFPSANTTSDSAKSIIRLAQDVLFQSSGVSVVKIPNNAYDAILLELQNKNAKVLDEGAQRPAHAKVLFQLRSESGDRAQVLYLD
jgi:hypothetical protein